MSELSLTINPDEIGRPVLEEPGRALSGPELARALRRFLREQQPWLAERVRIVARRDCALVRAAAPDPHRPGTRSLEILRALEGAVGMADKLPEVAEIDSLPEMDMKPGDFDLDIPEPDPAPRQAPVTEALSSKVRYFPVPEASWYEICDGTLKLTNTAIIFEAAYRVEYSEAQPRDHRLPLAGVREVLRDTWCRIPCLRVETAEAAYRYGWPARRSETQSIFTVSEWLTALQKVVR